VLALVWRSRARLAGRPVDGFGRALAIGRAGAGASGATRGDAHPAATSGSAFGFLKLPAVWMSFAFFFTLAVALGGVQTFGPESARVLHEVDARWVALCLTLYMLTGAVGQLVGGQLVTDPARAERIVVVGFGLSMAVAALLGLVSWPGWMVPVLFAAMGFGSGVAGPSRDLMVRRASPPGATGRVYGTVYAGLDVGMALGPVVFGWLLDHGQPRAVWIGIALFQLLLVLNALNLGRMTRAGVARAAGAGAAAAR
jgi:predicted MFS family arabinose efflux permease